MTQPVKKSAMKLTATRLQMANLSQFRRTDLLGRTSISKQFGSFNFMAFEPDFSSRCFHCSDNRSSQLFLIRFRQLFPVGAFFIDRLAGRLVMPDETQKENEQDHGG
jgi:hypothetical protein